MPGNFNFHFDMLLKNNPAQRDRQGTMLFDKASVGQIGEMNFVKIGTLIVASFFLDNFGKDIVIFDISESIGKDMHFSFNFKNGKVIQMFVSASGDSFERGETKFIRCPKKT